MEARDEHDRAVHYAVEETIRKAMDEGAASSAAQARVSLGPLKNCFHGNPNLREELLTESLALRLVPSMGTHDIGCGLRTENVICHRDRARI